jgi:HTH-type transcriptional regulator/antitoxin HigA
MNKNNYLAKGINIEKAIPSKAIHPGEELCEELKSRGISQKKFSDLTKILPSQLNEIIKGKRVINAELAIIIGTALNMDPILWAKSQMFYELDLARIKLKSTKKIKLITSK